MPTFADRYQGLTLPVRKESQGFFTLHLTRDVIKASMRMILATNFGERVCLPEFGSRLQQLLFEPNDAVLVTLVRRYVIDSLSRWERRITVQSVQTLPRENEVRVKIGYTINESQDADQLVLVFARGA